MSCTNSLTRRKRSLAIFPLRLTTSPNITMEKSAHERSFNMILVYSSFLFEVVIREEN